MNTKLRWLNPALTAITLVWWGLALGLWCADQQAGQAALLGLDVWIVGLLVCLVGALWQRYGAWQGYWRAPTHVVDPWQGALVWAACALVCATWLALDWPPRPVAHSPLDALYHARSVLGCLGVSLGYGWVGWQRRAVSSL